MAKYFASDKGVRAVDIEGARFGHKRTLKPDSKGFYEVTNAMDAKALKASGFVEASLSGITSTAVGFTCVACGFGSFFRKCSKCGNENAET